MLKKVYNKKRRDRGCLCSLWSVFQRRLWDIFPIAATSNATIRNAIPVHKRLPVNRYAAIAAKAAKGNASKNLKANMTTKPITNRIISSHQKLGSDKFIPNIRILFKQIPQTQ
jgi:hypothetical protein